MRTTIFLVLSTILLYIPAAKSQDVTNKFRIGMAAGWDKNSSSERLAFGRHTGFTADYNKFNYSFGGILEYGLKSNLSLNGALNYTNRDFTGTYFCDVCDFEFPPSPEEADFRFIEVPITVKYYFSPQKTRLFGEAGLNNLFQLNHPGYEARVNSYVIGFKLGGGVEYNLSPKTALQLSLNYNNTLSKLFKDAYHEGPYFRLKTFNFGVALLKKI